MTRASIHVAHPFVSSTSKDKSDQNFEFGASCSDKSLPLRYITKQLARLRRHRLALRIILNEGPHHNKVLVHGVRSHGTLR